MAQQTPVDPRGLTAQRLGWRDNIQGFLGAKLAGTKDPTLTAMQGNIAAYSFSHLSVNELIVSYHIDHDYAPGTAVYPHVHWSPSDTGTGIVRWGFEYTVARGHQQEAFPASQTIYIEQAGTGTALMHQIAETDSPGITIPRLEPDTLLLVRVFRDATHENDTYGAACFGLLCDLHYQTDRYATLGKRPDFEKLDQN